MIMIGKMGDTTDFPARGGSALGRTSGRVHKWLVPTHAPFYIGKKRQQCLHDRGQNQREQARFPLRVSGGSSRYQLDVR